MDLDTSIGGNQSRFPETRRSAVVDFNSGDASLRECAAEALISAYWKPVYQYIRVRRSRSNEDANDLTQAFFARALEKEFFRGYDPEKARFRTYLRACLAAFLSQEDQAARRIKRGGDTRVVSLDFETAQGDSTTLRRTSCRRKSISTASGSAISSPWLSTSSSAGATRTANRSRTASSRATISVKKATNRLTGVWPLNSAFPLRPSPITLRPCGARIGQVVLERIRESTATEREYKSEVRAVLGIKV